MLQLLSLGGDADPTKPAFTPSAFPHIWDHILELVDKSALTALRATSHDLLDRIGKELYSHVAVHIDMSKGSLFIWLSDPYTQGRIPGLDWNSSPLDRGLCLRRLESHCTTVDEVVHTYQPQRSCNYVVCWVRDQRPILDRRALVELEAALCNVTTHRRHGKEYQSMFHLPCVRRLVAFLTAPGYGMFPTVSRPYNRHDWRSPKAFVPSTGVRTVVINMPMGSYAKFLGDIENLSSVVVILPTVRWTSSLWNLLVTASDLLPRVRFSFLGLEAITHSWEQCDLCGHDSHDPVPEAWANRRHSSRREIALYVCWAKATRDAENSVWQEVERKTDWKRTKDTVPGKMFETYVDWKSRVVKHERLVDRNPEAIAEIGELLDAITVETLESQRKIMGENLFLQATVPPERSKLNRRR
ncbi:uncharacterized protein LOC62_07G008891 [Vanrija pseudolonga]|uniref:Uncharacterized protein n=1 Tax=Vanrija pseudolonga TaxID=143232 RepID=A0AAF1BLS2_9TREE|nr:hypothetical protein LOC62_07G008891 [Vanrija pseudolonga]